MFRLVLIILLLGFTSNVLATHIVGGEMYYDYLGANQYKITLKLYRDCNSTGAQYDNPLPLTIFDGNGTQLSLENVPFPGSNQIPPQFSNPCINPPQGLCVELAVYERIINLPASNTGWIISYQRCCRTPSVVNLNNPADQGLTLTVEIPPVNQIPINSSPRYNLEPPLVICTNDPLIFDHSATDPDGDSLVYSLCTPYQGGSSMNPAPGTASPPPYALVNWAGGMSATNPFGQGTITIDSQTGLLEADPDVPGFYVIGVCVSEYRNGVLIGTNIRDYIFQVINCDVTLAADMVQQPDLSTFVSYCEGLTIQFENNSFGGTNYYWDFGVPGITTDNSSSFAPSYTYPGPGTYDVMLVVNPGWPCSDTAWGTFIVNNEIDVYFEPPEPQCVIGNSFNFQAQGTYPSTGTTFTWNFGSDATPTSSTSENPTNIVYNTPGSKSVTVTVNYDQCQTSHSEIITVASPPSINFTAPDELKCVPYTAQFTNLSTADTPISSFWDFGDGATSTDFSPSHTYDQVGTYDVTLTIWTEAGCIDTLTMHRPNLIEVFPRPTSVFDVTPYEQLEYDNEYFFTDQSDTNEVVESWFYFADGSYTTQDSVYHHYNDPGVYLPWQIVFNEYGCYDKSYQEIKIIPVMEVMVPNAFTPNGDSHNNIFQPVMFEDVRYELWIYNRWGEEIHYDHKVNANWDGSSNGVLVPDGIYVWRIRYYSFRDPFIPVVIEGHVTVLR